MSKASILQLIEDLTFDEADTSTYAGEEDIDEIFAAMAKLLDPPLVAWNSYTVGAGKKVYSFDTDLNTYAVRILILTDENERELAPTSIEGMEMIDKDWRTTSDSTPWVYILDEETARTLRLWPASSAGGSGVVIFSNKNTDIASGWMELPLAFKTMDRIFRRPSSYEDIEYANLCKDIAQTLFDVGRVSWQ